jgi:hypothetical protein
MMFLHIEENLATNTQYVVYPFTYVIIINESDARMDTDRRGRYLFKATITVCDWKESELQINLSRLSAIRDGYYLLRRAVEWCLD